MSTVSVGFVGDTGKLGAAIEQSKSWLAQFTNAVRASSASAQASSAATNDSFKSTEDASKRASNTMGDYARKVAGGVGGVTAGLGALAAAGVAAIEVVGNHAIAVVAPVQAAAGAFDQTLQSMSGVNAIAARAGLGLTELGGAFANIQTKARAGDEAIVTALNAIGLKARDVANISQDALAVKMADAFSRSVDSSNKAAAGVVLFGAAAGKLVPQLDQGAARLRDLEAAADRAGTVIGPDLAAKVQGTNALFQVFGDSVRELRATVDGKLLQTFVQVKPAADGLARTFADVIGNVTSLTEWFYELNGAGQKSAESTGLLATASQYFAKAIVQATVYVEELAVRGVQRLADLGLSFNGLSGVATAFGNDVRAMAANSASALYDAFNAAISGVINLFGDLARAGAAALSFDFSGVAASFAQLGAHAREAGEQIKSNLSPDLLSGTRKAWDDMQIGASASAKSLDSVIDRLHKQRDATIALIEAGGQKGANVAQTQAVGNPIAPTRNADADADRVRAALRAIDAEVQAVREGEQRKAMLIDAGVQLHQISEGQKVNATRAALDEELAAQLALYRKGLEIDGLKLAQRQDLLNKMRAAQASHDTAVLRLQIEAAVATQRTWDQAASEISGAFNSQIDGLLRGTTKLSQAFKNIFVSLIESLIRQTVEWGVQNALVVAKNIAGIEAQTAAQVAGATAGATAQTAGAAAGSTSIVAGILKSISASAAEAFAGVTGFLSPIMGPAAIGPAAATEATVLAAAAGVAAFDIGSWSLPSTGLAMVHAGEMIVPAAQTPWAQSLLSAGGGGERAAVGDTHNHFSPNIELHTHGKLTRGQIDDAMGQIFKAAHRESRRIGNSQRR